MTTAPQTVTFDLKRLPLVTFTLILINLFFYSIWHQPTIIGCIDCGFYTGKWIGLTLVSHMFVHAGLLNLISNLLFLALLGYMTERLLGRHLFLALYLGSGLVVTILALMFVPETLVPGFGTSGAISGVLGLSAVIFGHRQIPLLKLSSRYANVQSMPVFGLLPLWISIEFIQFMVYSNSQMNYLVHILGLLIGAVVVLVIKKTHWVSSVSLFDGAAIAKDIDAEMDRAGVYFGEQQFSDALKVLRQIYREACGDLRFLSLYYQCGRHFPQQEDVHRAARKIFNLPERDSKTVDLIVKTYRNYIRLAEPGPRFNESMLFHLADLFVDRKWGSELDKIMLLMRKKHAACLFDSNLPYRYAKLLDEQGRTSEGLDYLKNIT
ncbi:MAG: rhomboid family intramembrane serine protease [Candidatus Thiodiazotropha lotti]|uniref:Rhomboid family intramembrane serine protease n=1 Tax=Candidatus Thiodiazotropha lotti TaxID=2792787 RepID=A0A9E4K9W4_9GAMM|nr:rhomboid family intramembrane serine protease [Candidatus Thiodiazotropha lotti]MCW4205620.1 rhomboid family intramembrane serine protease [Candidatus Thiodiazotropha lotti]